MARAEPVIAVCLAGAPIIQLFDMQLLREQIIASIADGPGAEEFEPGQFARLTIGARHGDQQPPYRARLKNPSLSSRLWSLASFALLTFSSRPSR